MFNPSDLNLPSFYINFISCCLRLMLIPEHPFPVTDLDVIQRVGGGLEMFNYWKPTRSVLNTAEVLAETFEVGRERTLGTRLPVDTFQCDVFLVFK